MAGAGFFHVLCAKLKKCPGNGFGGSDVASEKMIANYANMLLKAVSYNIVSLFKLFVLEKKFQRRTVETLRYFKITRAAAHNQLGGKIRKEFRSMILLLWWSLLC
jgi:hypothetical protein